MLTLPVVTLSRILRSRIRSRRTGGGREQRGYRREVLMEYAHYEVVKSGQFNFVIYSHKPLFIEPQRSVQEYDL